MLNGDVQEVAPNAVFVPGGSDYPLVNTRNGGSDQLTLSFKGKVYVFDAISPDKVLNFVNYDSLFFFLSFLCFGGNLSEGGLWVLVNLMGSQSLWCFLDKWVLVTLSKTMQMLCN
ncbi:hypothetical protein ACB092_01G136900 [Castanea dentata]